MTQRRIDPWDLDEHLDEEHVAALRNVPIGLNDLTDIDAARECLRRFLDRPTEVQAVPNVSITDHRLTVPDRTAGVRVYRPASGRRVRPALFWMHGGGMVMGDVSVGDGVCARWADQLDVLVVSMDYNLAPEFPYPAAMEDCFAGLSWMFESIDELGVDSSRVAVGGTSSGGGLAAGLALLQRDRAGAELCFQLLISPMLDDRNETPSSFMITDPRVWNRDSNIAAWQAYLSGLDDDETPPIYAAPARASDLAGLPPAMLAVGEVDLFVDEDIAYAQALLRDGVSTDLRVYRGAFHGSNNAVPGSSVSRRWNRDVLESLDRALND